MILHLRSGRASRVLCWLHDIRRAHGYRAVIPHGYEVTIRPGRMRCVVLRVRGTTLNHLPQNTLHDRALFGLILYFTPLISAHLQNALFEDRTRFVSLVAALNASGVVERLDQ